MAVSLRQILLPSCVFAIVLVLGAVAGWSGAASSVLAALVAVMVAAISTMVTAMHDLTSDVTRGAAGQEPRDR